MKLHLPKGLLTAVLAVVGAWAGLANAETITITAAGDANLTGSYDLIILNLQGAENESNNIYFNGEGNGGSRNITSAVQIDACRLNNGYSTCTYNFSNTITGEGDFILQPVRSFNKQYYVFSGNMADYSGNMILSDGKESYFKFNGNTSGTGTITANGGNKVIVAGATMQNSSISTTTLEVTGTSSFAGDVTATTLNASGTATFAGDVTAGTLTLGENSTVTIGANKTLTIDSLVATSTYFKFEEGATLVYNVSRLLADGALVGDKVYGFKKDKQIDIFKGTSGMDEARRFTIAGSSHLVDADGRVWDSSESGYLLDNFYYISGDVNASVVNADLLTAGPHDGFELNGGTLNMDADLTLTGGSMLTATTVAGTGKLIVANGSSLQVDNDNGKKLQSNMHIMSGGTMTFLGTGCDAINYGQTGRTIYVDGTMDFGTTRQTVGNWTFEMTGGTIQGTGAMSNNNLVAMDFHSGNGVKGYINAKALAGATAEAPTVSTINAPVRMGCAVDFDVEGNARLDMLGVLIGNSKLTKTGDGVLRLQNNGNTYNAVDVTDGTLEVRDNAVTMNSAVTVSGGAQMQILQNETCANTLENVTINNGSLLVQNTVHHNNNNTTITNLTVAEGGATIGMVVNSAFNSTNNAKKITIGTLAGSGDLHVCGDGSQISTVYVNGGTDFSGNVQVTSAAGKRTDLDLASNTALANSVVVLGGGSGETSSSTTYFVLGSADTAVKGIQDAEGRKSGGGVIIRTSNTPSTLTIDTGDDDYSTKSGVGKYINLVKKGSGTQSFGNEVSNSNSGVFSGSIDVQGGTLAFTKEGASTTVSSLTLSGGSLDVTGSLTLNALSVDFSKYSTDKSHTLVSSGGLSLGADVNLDNLTFSEGDYTGSVAKVGESLVLTWEAPTPSVSSITTSITKEEGWYTLSPDGMTLTLTVDGSLAGLAADGSVMVNLLTDGQLSAIMSDANYKNPYVLLELTDSDKNTVAADAFNRVVFIKGETGQNYWGEMYDFGGEVGTKLAFNVERIPEPTTATLSLLALMGLAARRRRK